MRVLLTFSIAFAAAVLLALLAFPQTACLVLAGVFLILALIFFLYRRRALRFAVVSLGLAAGLLWCTGYQVLRIAPARTLDGKTVVISGVASDYSVKTDRGIRVDAKITVDGVKTSGRVWLSTEESLSPGDSFTVSAELSDARQEDDYYNWSEGIYLLAYGKSAPEIFPEDRIPLRYLPRYVAHRLEQTLKACVPSDAQGYAVALTTGDRQGLSNLEKANLKTSGIYHALALSGMHLTTLLGLVFLLVPQKRRQAYIGIPISILFTLVTGAKPAMVRACVMECLVLLAPLLDREEDAPTSLGAAALLLMLQNPCCILGWGTQLSFSSMAGILLFSEKLQEKMLGDRQALKRRPKVLSHSWYTVTASLSATLSATVLSLPLMMLHFGMFSLIAPVTNLLTGWAVTWTFRLSLLTGIVGTFLPAIGQGMGWVLAWGIRYISAIAGLMAKLPFAVLYADSVYVVIWVAACYAVLLLVIRTDPKQRSFTEPVCCLILLLCVCLGLSQLENMAFTFTVLDVGQGQCLLARVNDQTLMIDCGGSRGEATGDIAASYLDALGESRVDLLILTHYDSDHAGGVPELLRRIHVETLVIPDDQPDTDIRLEIERTADETGSKLLFVSTDHTAQVDACSVSIFASEHMGSEDNEGLSILLEHEQTQILITGDMDAAGERQLLREHALPDVDILVAGHHGSKFSTSEALLYAVRPEIVVISVGDNSYGHPASETISRISETGAMVYRTDQNGTIRLKEA